MANKKTIALDMEQYKQIIKIIQEGFEFDDVKIRSNIRIATILVLQANLGLRIGDILNLKLKDITKDGDRYRLNIIEQKTLKDRTFTVPLEVYNYIKLYTLENNIKITAKIFPISVRAVQKHLKLVCSYLKLENISTHSFRKYFATQIYINNDYNITLVKTLLQHSNITTTQRYIGISSSEIESALKNHIQLL